MNITLKLTALLISAVFLAVNRTEFPYKNYADVLFTHKTKVFRR